MITAVLYESSSLPILEAAASGLPIIASDTPPNKEMAKNLKINLFESNNHKKLAKLIYNSWIDFNGDSQIKYNLNKINRYSWDSIASNYILEINKILN